MSPLAPERTEFVTVAPSALNSDSSQGSKQGVSGIRLRRPLPSDKKMSLLDRAYEQFCKLREAGEAVDPEEFCGRHHRVQSSLARLIEAHRFLEEHPDLLDETGTKKWPRSGEHFAGFSLLGELGQGAFARVFQAEESALGNRLVAVKISPEISTEAAILGRINHPNIVPVYSVREEPITGLSVVCMPYLGSATLSQVLDLVHAGAASLTESKSSLILEAIREPGLAPPAHAASILRRGSYVDGIRWIGVRIAEALAFIHGKGICHRDLKPSNVLMKPDGTPMLLDFNLSTDVLLPETKMGGTPVYMAPEQLRAVTRSLPHVPYKPDGRADLYSLGVIMYELLTGTHPFGPIPLRKSSAEVREHLLSRQGQNFRPIRELNPTVDKTLAKAIEACLAAKPEERPASAADLVKLLQKGFAPVRRATRFLMRFPKTVAAACVLLMGLGSAGAFHVATLPAADVRQYNQAQDAFRQGHYQQAIFHLNQVLQIREDNEDALWMRGRSFQKLGGQSRDNYYRAIDDFRAADKIAPSGRARASVGYCYHILGKNEEALLFYQQAVRANFDTAELANNMGVVLSAKHKDEWRNAHKSYENALKMDPNLAAASFNRAILYQKECGGAPAAKQKDLLKNGIESLTHALKNGPPTTDLAFDLAKLYAMAARHEPQWSEPALEYLRIAMARGLDPKKLASVDGSVTFRAIKDRPEFIACRDSQQIGQESSMARLLDPIRD